MDDNFWVIDGHSETPSVYKKRKRSVGIRKMEFLGWASKPLIEFLEAMNLDIEKEYSQLELVTVILRYINDKGLGAQGKKKKVICDERLFSLFGKRSIPRKKIYELLEEHLHAKCDDSEDESLDSSEEEDIRKKDFTSLRVEPRRSFFAAVVPENIKLIYLKKSLIRDLLQDPTSFEKKILGSFVRMKSDPNDIFQKNPFQLQLVTGVENFALALSSGAEIHVKVANFFKEVPFSMLSDDDFSEEEVEDVRKRITGGMLKKFSVKEIELKAQMLHKDITKHWITKELALLQKRIDHANEKGWRRELFEYLDRRKMLQTPSEQEKLLNTTPSVIDEEPEAPVASTAGTAETNGVHFLESNFRHGADARSSGGIGLADLSCPSQSHDSHPQEPVIISSDGVAAVKNRNGYHQAHVVHVADDILPHESNRQILDLIPSGKSLGEAYGQSTLEYNNSTWISYPVKPKTSQMLSFVSRDLACEVKPQQVELEDAISIQTKELVIDDAGGYIATRRMHEVSTIHAEISRETGTSGKHDTSSISATISIPGHAMESQVRPVVASEMIELSSDDDDSEPGPELIDAAVWHYVDPRGKTQGPFSLQALKRWNDANYFHAGFTIWKTGQEAKDGVPLADVLRRSFR